MLLIEASTMETGSSATITRGLSKKARDHETLPLAAAQLVGILPQRLGDAQPHKLQCRADQLPGLSLTPGEVERAHRDVKDVIDLIERVVGLVGILQDSLDLTPKDACLTTGHARHVRAAIDDLAAGGRQEAEDEAGRRRLPAPALSREGHDPWLVGRERQREVVQGHRRRHPLEEASTEGLRHVAYI
jgi:hypothetical protein